MISLRALLIGGILSLAVCDAGGPATYLPAAGPAPLRFKPDPASRPPPSLPPLVMRTPPPVDPDSLGTNPSPQSSRNSEAYPTPPSAGPAGTSTSAASDSETTPSQIFGAPGQSPAVNPYADGIVPQPEGGWWRLLVTNKYGLMSVPIPAVDFAPPAVSTLPSRATYTTVP